MKFVEIIGEKLLTSIPMKLVLVVISVLEMLFFSGIMYGINTLYPIFTDKKYFANCPDIKPAECLEKNFGYVIIVGNVIMTLGAYLCGLILDKFGHFVLKLITAICFVVGVLCYSFSDSYNWLLFVGQVLLSINAESMILCLFPISSLILKKFQNVIVAIMSGAFDSSSGVYTLIYQAYIGSIKLEFRTSCLIYGCVGFVIMVSTAVFLLTGVDWVKKKEEDHIIEESDEMEETLSDNVENILETLNVYTNKKYPSMVSVLKSRLFWCHTILFTIVFFRFSYFLAQLPGQLAKKNFPATNTRSTPASLETINKLLVQINYFLFSSILISPFVGLLIEFLKMNKLKKNKVGDHNSSNDSLVIEHVYENLVRSFAIPYFICCFANLVAAIFISIPNNIVWIYIAYVGLIITRSFLFSLNSAFLLQVFPKKLYGELFGIVFAIAGVVSLIQFGLLNIDQVKSMDITNYILIVLSFIPLVQPINLVLFRNAN